MLGAHADGFALDVWVQAIADRAERQKLALTDRDGVWAWVQAELTTECRSRGIPLAGGSAAASAPPANRWTPSAREAWRCPHTPHCEHREACAVVTSRHCPHDPPCSSREVCMDRVLGGAA